MSAAERLAVRVAVDRDEIQVGERFAVAFQRTLRIPEDGRVYPLPPGLGRIPIIALEGLRERLPESLREADFAIGLYRREAMWIAFVAPSWHPHAVQVFAGEVNAIDGGSAGERLTDAPQNYVVAPTQPWLDGVNAGVGHVRQFVALGVDDARTIEAQLRGRAARGGVRIRVVPPKPGRFPVTPPAEPTVRRTRSTGVMGLGAGGKVAQRIYQDQFGIDTWDETAAVAVDIAIVEAAALAALTGRPAPASPVTAETYVRHHLPWFALYDDDVTAVAPGPAFERMAPAATGLDDEPGVDVADEDVRPIGRDRPKR